MFLLFVRCLFNQLQHSEAYKTLLMPWTRDPPEKLTVLQQLKKILACYGTQSFLLQSMSSYCMYWRSTSIFSSSLHLGLSCSENMFSVSKNYIFITVIHNWRQQKWKCRQMLRGCVIVKFHLNALYTMIYMKVTFCLDPNFFFVVTF